jgi:WD40 repeat protein
VALTAAFQETGPGRSPIQANRVVCEPARRLFTVAISADGGLVVSGGEDGSIRVWDVRSQSYSAILVGHFDSVHGLALTGDGKIAVSASSDRTLRVWDLSNFNCIAKLEGHTKGIYSAAVTPDGSRAASEDETVRAWDLGSGLCVGILEGTCPAYTVAITKDGQKIVTGNDDGTVRVWRLSRQESESGSTRYTNAKVLLVGETGVGKTGLALRLTQDTFEPTVSTDAAWATQLRLPTAEGTNAFEREVWLWDFGGQADYRLVHQLFMDDTALAALVFDPQSEDHSKGCASGNEH